MIPKTNHLVSNFREHARKAPANLRWGIIGAGFVILYVLSYRTLGLPSNEELVLIARDLFNRYGYIVIFIAALIEGLLLVGLYLPGSTVVLLGGIFSRSGALDIRGVVLTAMAGFVLAYVADYVLGRYGGYPLLIHLRQQQSVERMESRFKQMKDIKRISLQFLNYAQPNLGTVVAVTAGILHLNILEFTLTALVATAFWGLFWATLAYMFGPIVITIISSWLIIPAILAFLVLSFLLTRA